MTEVMKYLDSNEDQKVSKEEVQKLVKKFTEDPECKNQLAQSLEQRNQDIINELKDSGTEEAIEDFFDSPEGQKLLEEFNPMDPEARNHPAYLIAKTLAFVESKPTTEGVETTDLEKEAMNKAVDNKISVNNDEVKELVLGERTFDEASKTVTIKLEVSNDGALQNLVKDGAEIQLTMNEEGKLETPQEDNLTKFEDG